MVCFIQTFRYKLTGKTWPKYRSVKYIRKQQSASIFVTPKMKSLTKIKYIETPNMIEYE